MLFDHAEFTNHEQIVFAREPMSGLEAIIAVHSTVLGPAVGGLRLWSYANDAEALTDVLRLSQGMTYKAAVAGLHLGGGKAVVLTRSGSRKSPELMHAIGHQIERLGGRYITGEDVGTDAQDMSEIRKVTRYVMGMSISEGGSGDPSGSTALGCFVGLQAAAQHALGKGALRGVHVAVQGLGHVGFNLCRLLAEAGATLTITDVQSERAETAARQFKARSVSPESIYDVEADIFSPCAMGAVVNDDTLPRFRVKVIAGAANNQLQQRRHGETLAQRGSCMHLTTLSMLEA